MSLPDKIWSQLLGDRRRDFLVSPEISLNYGAIKEGIGSWLSAFDEAHMMQGDRFVLRTADDTVAMTAFLAGLVDGIVPVVLEGSCPDARLTSIITTVAPKLVVCDTHLPRLSEGIVGRTRTSNNSQGRLQRLFGSGKTHPLAVGDPAATRNPRLPPEDGLAYLIFTSGTTSAPVGVEINRASLAANLTTLSRLAGCNAESRIFNDMILAHADGMIQGPVLAAWNGAVILRGGGLEVSRIEDWLSCIRAYRATDVLTVPTVWAMIDKYAGHDDYFDAPECKMLVSVAAKMPDALWLRIEARFGKKLVSHYGLTETVASALYSGDHPEMGAPCSIGIPIDCAARIADGAAEGELQLKGDNLFSGYWMNAARTKESFTSDGYFRTGDLAKHREDGSFEIIGRLKTVIMAGGVLIRPDEVDEALLLHPHVVEAATVGVPDDMFGEVGLTGVVLAEEVSETVLTEHLRAHIEPRKIPKRIITLTEIPRGLSGKVQLKTLRTILVEVINGGVLETLGDDITAVVLKIAAKVFRVPVECLFLHSTQDDVEGWDSFTQLNLVLSIEKHFQCHISAAHVSGLRRLDDFVAVLKDRDLK